MGFQNLGSVPSVVFWVRVYGLGYMTDRIMWWGVHIKQRAIVDGMGFWHP